MKLKLPLLLLGVTVAAWLVAGLLSPRRPSEAPETPKGPPHGGLLIELDTARLEFLLDPESRVRVWTYDSQGQPKAPLPGETLRMSIHGSEPEPSTVDLQEQGQGYVSPTSVQVPEGARARLSFFQPGATNHYRFALILEECAGCERPEYRCACRE
jgi:hypothetical protein